MGRRRGKEVAAGFFLLNVWAYCFWVIESALSNKIQRKKGKSMLLMGPHK